MRYLIIGLMFLIACKDETQKAENLEKLQNKYLNFDSIQLAIFDSTLPRGGREPYELEKSVFDSKLNVRFDYYIFNNDGQLFPLKLVIVSNDSLSFTLDFKEERKINSYNLGDSTIPTSTIGGQLNRLFNQFRIKKPYEYIFIYTLFHEVMGLDFVQPYHKAEALKSFRDSGSDKDSLVQFYHDLEKRGIISYPKDFDMSPRRYDVYNLWDYSCFYKVTFDDSCSVQCLFPENYRMFLW
jgi:hypothetical protein